MRHSQPKSIARRIADVMVDRASRGCTLADLLDEGFSQDDITRYGTEAETLARKAFVRQAHADATDQLAREDIEGAARNILVSIPASDLCQIWQGLRDGNACTPIEATLRLSQAFAEEVAP